MQPKVRSCFYFIAAIICAKFQYTDFIANNYWHFLLDSFYCLIFTFIAVDMWDGITKGRNLENALNVGMIKTGGESTDVRPQKFFRWVNVYESYEIGYACENKEKADAQAIEDRIACIKIEFEKGEGL